MKIAKVLSTAVLSVFLLSACGGGKGIITVNDEPITKAEYDKAYKQATDNPQFAALGADLKDPDSFFNLMTKDRVVNELIVKKILDQEIKKRNIVATEEDVKKAKEDIIEKVGGEEKFKDVMKQNNVSEKQLNEDIKNEVLVNKLVEQAANVAVSDADVKNFYDNNKQNFNFPERVRASHILIAANTDEIRKGVVSTDKDGKLNAAQIEEKLQAELKKQMAVAKEVRDKLLASPGDFEKLAKEYSTDPGSKDKGGDLGFFPREAMVKPFADVAFSIKPNTISEIIETPFGYHILIVTDRSKAGIAPFDQVAPEIRTYLEQTKKIEALQKLFDGLKASAKVVYVDQQYDPANIQKKIREKAAQQAAQQQAPQEGQTNTEPFTPAPAQK